jgi:hypothetical protein
MWSFRKTMFYRTKTTRKLTTGFIEQKFGVECVGQCVECLGQCRSEKEGQSIVFGVQHTTH